MTTDALFQQLKHPNPNLRERAIWELAETTDDAIIPQLMDNLTSEDMVYRRASVRTLGAIGLPAVPALIEALKTSKDETARTSCVKALAQVAVQCEEGAFPDEGFQALALGMEDENPLVGLTAVMALGQVGAPALDVLIETMKTTENVAVATSIANTLGSINDPKSVAALEAAISDESSDPYVKELAKSSLDRMRMFPSKP
ncbi:MAG: HEAT repeat domain-containing protein [Cyanobacteria bacterium P01_F01_bin.153]